MKKYLMTDFYKWIFICSNRNRFIIRIGILRKVRCVNGISKEFNIKNNYLTFGTNGGSKVIKSNPFQSNPLNHL